ncbi:MAG TPA: DedA family protein [Ktedonobacteraceae bacterium]|nr:DedA family protein [Ktedonobacteraceae bacterium]
MVKYWLSLIHLRLLALHSLPLAALISLDTLRNALNTLGYPAVALFVMIESSGIPFPGETMLLLASFYAAVDQKLQIPFVIACAALGAIIGDNIGYTVGRTGGYAFIQRFGRYLFLKPAHLERAERFFSRHGDKTVFFGRFIAVLRAWAAFLAGINRMRWSSFLIYNAAGGIVWAIIYGCLGFYAGRIFHDNFGEVEHLASTISWVGALTIVAALVVVFIIFRLRRRHHNSHTDNNPSSASAQMPAEQPTATPGNVQEPETPSSSAASAQDDSGPALGEPIASPARE